MKFDKALRKQQCKYSDECLQVNQALTTDEEELSIADEEELSTAVFREQNCQSWS